MVHDDLRAVHLRRCCEARAARAELAAQRDPAPKHLADRLVGRHAEAARRTRRRERAHPECVGVGNDLRRGNDAPRPATLVVRALDVRAECAQPFVDALVAALDLRQRC